MHNSDSLTDPLCALSGSKVHGVDLIPVSPRSKVQMLVGHEENRINKTWRLYTIVSLSTDAQCRFLLCAA